MVSSPLLVSASIIIDRCGPCKASKPQLEALAAQYSADSSTDVACGIIYEHVLGDEIQSYQIRAFPTYVLFNQTAEAGRVAGVNFDGIKALVAQHCKSHDFGQGASLGGTNATSVEDARARRLARFGGGGNGNVPGSSKADAVVKDDAAGGGEEEYVYKDEDNDEEMKDAAQQTADDAAATEEAKADDKMDVDEPSAEKNEAEKKDEGEVEMVDPTADLKDEDIKTLTEEYGFPLIRAQKGLINGGGTVEGAASWLCEHLEDADIDEPIEKVPKKSGAVKSYRCVATGKLFTDMVAMEFYANKTGRTEFEECSEYLRLCVSASSSALTRIIETIQPRKRSL